MIDQVRKKVEELLGSDNSGHGMEHINRVVNLALKFASKEGANMEIVSLIALLHDVDDHKLFGLDNAKNLTNTKRILDECSYDIEIKNQVISEVSSIGYSKLLNGNRPKTLEGMIVSDADMCDGIGATGILRSYKYNLKHGNLFFDKDYYPTEDISYLEYVNKEKGTVVNHMFEKLLKLNSLMMTSSGKDEAEKRHQFMIQFLYEIFDEENASDWIDYLDQYVKKL